MKLIWNMHMEKIWKWMEICALHFELIEIDVFFGRFKNMKIQWIWKCAPRAFDPEYEWLHKFTQSHVNIEGRFSDDLCKRGEATKLRHVTCRQRSQSWEMKLDYKLFKSKV